MSFYVKAEARLPLKEPIIHVDGSCFLFPVRYVAVPYLHERHSAGPTYSEQSSECWPAFTHYHSYEKYTIDMSNDFDPVLTTKKFFLRCSLQMFMEQPRIEYSLR